MRIEITKLEENGYNVTIDRENGTIDINPIQIDHDLGQRIYDLIALRTQMSESDCDRIAYNTMRDVEATQIFNVLRK